MSDNQTSLPDFDTMTPSQFEEYLPEFFGTQNSHVSTDPRLQKFLERNPDCAALVRDLEAIAQVAIDLFPVQDPSDDLWDKIKVEFNKDSPPIAELD